MSLDTPPLIIGILLKFFSLLCKICLLADCLSWVSRQDWVRAIWRLPRAVEEGLAQFCFSFWIHKSFLLWRHQMNSSRTLEMAQWFKCLLHKSGPVWIPRICIKVTRCQYLPIVPDLESRDRAPQSKLASQSSRICQLWAWSRAPALMSKVAGQRKRIPCVHTHTHSCIHMCSSTHTHAHKQEKGGKFFFFHNLMCFRLLHFCHLSCSLFQ